MTAEAPFSRARQNAQLAERLRRCATNLRNDNGMVFIPLIDEAADALERSEQSLAQARELLREYLACGVSWSDERIDYEEVQIPRLHTADVRQFLAQHGPDGG